MDMKLFTTFVVLNILNVVVQTIKSLVTNKCGKEIASLVNAVAYGLYQIILVYSVCDLPLWSKVVVVALANLMGVYVVKLGEEKIQKDKLWKIEMTIPAENTEQAHKMLEFFGNIPHSYVSLGPKYTLFNIYCADQEQSKKVKLLVEQYGAKYFIAEGKDF